MVDSESTFWEQVREPFMNREINRLQVREIVADGLRRSDGSFKRLVTLFGLPESDYVKFMDFLRHHDLKPTPPGLHVLPERRPTREQLTEPRRLSEQADGAP